MKYYLQINFRDNTLYHLRADAARLRAVIDDLNQFQILSGLRYYKPARSKKRSLTPFSNWTEIKNVPEDYLHICDKNRLESASKMLEVNFLFDKISLSIESNQENIDLFNQIEETFELLLSVTQKHGLMPDLWSGLRILEIGFKQPRPPRNMGRIPTDALLDVINTKAPALSIDDLIEAYQRELPGNASLKSVGHYLIIDWINRKDVKQEAIASALTERLNWYYSHHDFPISGAYNEHGDSLIVLLNPVKHSFYTFYVSFDNTAYKAFVPTTPTLIEDEMIDSMLVDIERGKAPDGAKLSAVTLIFPSRKLAEKYYNEAMQLGFREVGYPDSEGNLWSLFSEGE